MDAKLAGRVKGVPNKATADVRAAIAKVAENTAPKIEAWLEAIEDEAKRFDLFLKMLEYHVPKLGRVELTGKDGGPLEVKVVRFDNAAQSVDPAVVPTGSMEIARTGLPPRRPVPSS